MIFDLIEFLNRPPLSLGKTVDWFLQRFLRHRETSTGLTLICVSRNAFHYTDSITWPNRRSCDQRRGKKNVKTR